MYAYNAYLIREMCKFKSVAIETCLMWAQDYNICFRYQEIAENL